MICVRDDVVTVHLPLSTAAVPLVVAQPQPVTSFGWSLFFLCFRAGLFVCLVPFLYRFVSCCCLVFFPVSPLTTPARVQGLFPLLVLLSLPLSSSSSRFVTSPLIRPSLSRPWIKNNTRTSGTGCCVCYWQRTNSLSRWNLSNNLIPFPIPMNPPYFRVSCSRKIKAIWCIRIEFNLKPGLRCAFVENNNQLSDPVGQSRLLKYRFIRGGCALQTQTKPPHHWRIGSKKTLVATSASVESDLPHFPPSKTGDGTVWRRFKIKTIQHLPRRPAHETAADGAVTGHHGRQQGRGAALFGNSGEMHQPGRQSPSQEIHL